MKNICLFALVGSVLFATAFQLPDSRSARRAMEVFEKSVERADAEREQAVRRAGRVLEQELEAAKATAMKAGDLDEANRIQAAIDTAAGVLDDSGSEKPVPSNIPPHAVKLAATGNWYALADVDVTWEEARAGAEAAGGMLMCINTPEELALAKMLAVGGDNPWVGATDAANEGQWVWLDGTPVADELWGRQAQPPRNSRKDNITRIDRDGYLGPGNGMTPRGAIVEWRGQ